MIAPKAFGQSHPDATPNNHSRHSSGWSYWCWAQRRMTAENEPAITGLADFGVGRITVGSAPAEGLFPKHVAERVQPHHPVIVVAVVRAELDAIGTRR